jgi:hypothetical protein
MTAQRKKYFKWNREMFVRLIDMREVHKLTYDEIAKTLGAPVSSCQKYYSDLRGRRVREAEAANKRPPPVVVKQPIITARTDLREHRPRAPLHPADAELSARIAALGLTAGVFGDPPPGRSALDQRRIA